MSRFTGITLAAFFLFACAAFGCAPAREVAADPEPVTPSADASPRVTDLTVTCSADVLYVSAMAAPGVASAYAELRRGEDITGFVLDNRTPPIIATPPGQADTLRVAARRAIFGQLELGEGSEITCDNLAELGVHVVVSFEDGKVECVQAGVLDELADAVCE
jgi:hypothetical protein